MTKKTYVFFSHFIYEGLLTSGFQKITCERIDVFGRQENKNKQRHLHFKYFKYICPIKMTKKNDVRFF